MVYVSIITLERISGLIVGFIMAPASLKVAFCVCTGFLQQLFDAKVLEKASCTDKVRLNQNVTK